VDITKRLMVRAGFRYEWGDSLMGAGLTAHHLAYETGQLKRYVGLAACSSVHAEVDAQRRLRKSNGVRRLPDRVAGLPELRALARITLPGLYLNLSENYLNNRTPTQFAGYLPFRCRIGQPAVDAGVPSASA